MMTFVSNFDGLSMRDFTNGSSIVASGSDLMNFAMRDAI